MTILFISGLLFPQDVPCFGKTLQMCKISLMSRRKFDEIMQNLHIPNNPTLDPNDKFSKVRLLIEKLNKQCLLQHLPEQTVSIDESMVPYFGRHRCKQFMRNKPFSLDIRFGLLLPH